MKYKSETVDLNNSANHYYNPSENIPPEKIYGPEWANSYIATEMYTDFDDQSHYSVSNHILVRADIETTDAAIFKALMNAAELDAAEKGIDIVLSWDYKTFEEAIFQIDFNILKANGIIPLAIYSVPTYHFIDNITDYSVTLDWDEI